MARGATACLEVHERDNCERGKRAASTQLMQTCRSAAAVAADDHNSLSLAGSVSLS